MQFLGRFGRAYHLAMPTFVRVLRFLSIVWAFVAVLGMSQAIAPSVEGQSMFATWAKSLGWLFGFELGWTGQETTEGMRQALIKSAGQFVFFCGWIAGLVLTRPRDTHGAVGGTRQRPG